MSPDPTPGSKPNVETVPPHQPLVVHAARRPPRGGRAVFALLSSYPGIVVPQPMRITIEVSLELNRIRSELATARETLRNIEWFTMVASVFVAIGGAAVSAAGYFDSWLRQGIVFGGAAVLFRGLVIQLSLIGGARADKQV